MIGRWAIAALVALAVPAAAEAQEASPAVLGARAGILAAQEPGVAERFLVGFIGGVPIGFFGLIAFGSAQLAVPAVAGAGLVWVAAAGGNATPGPSVQPTDRDLEFQRAFFDSYTEALSHRRRRSALWGGAAGTGVGVSLLILVLTQINWD